MLSKFAAAISELWLWSALEYYHESKGAVPDRDSRSWINSVYKVFKWISWKQQLQHTLFFHFFSSYFLVCRIERIAMIWKCVMYIEAVRMWLLQGFRFRPDNLSFWSWYFYWNYNFSKNVLENSNFIYPKHAFVYITLFSSKVSICIVHGMLHCQNRSLIQIGQLRQRERERKTKIERERGISYYIHMNKLPWLCNVLGTGSFTKGTCV